MVSANIAKGDRVEIHPRFDLWMRGATHGTVVTMVREECVMVKLDKWSKPKRFNVHDLKCESKGIPFYDEYEDGNANTSQS